jgi:hypothetical protein
MQFTIVFYLQNDQGVTITGTHNMASTLQGNRSWRVALILDATNAAMKQVKLHQAATASRCRASTVSKPACLKLAVLTVAD